MGCGHEGVEIKDAANLYCIRNMRKTSSALLTISGLFFTSGNTAQVMGAIAGGRDKYVRDSPFTISSL